MGLLSWVVFGALAGWVASIIVGRNNRQGCLMNIIVGIIGALLGGFLFSIVGETPVTGLNLWSFFVALIGSIILIAFFRAVRGPQH